MKDKLIAIGIIALILFIPIYTADALAFGIDVTKSSGNKLDDYFDGQGDNWIIEVNANIDGREVTPDMITVESGKTEYFDSCTVFGGSYQCIWDSGETTAAEGSYTVDVILKDKFTGREDKDTASITVDADNPRIVSFTATQDGTGVIVQYDVNDGNPSTSSGLDKIEFYDGGELLKLIDVSGYSASDTVEIEFDKDGLYEDQKITMKAYDRLGHIDEEENRNSLDLDLKPPEIYEGSFLIGDNDEYLPGNSRPVDISIEVEEESGLRSVNADFTALGLSSLVSADEIFNISDQVYKAVWKNKMVGAQGTTSITFSATDQFGNIGKETITRDFKVDSIAPGIDYFGSIYNYSEKSYIRIREINSIKLILRESQSGISKDNIIVDFKNVNKNLGKLSPDECVQDLNPDVYVCTWNQTINKAGPLFLVSVKDDAGNGIPSDDLFLHSVSLNTDTSIPEINSVEVISLGNQFQEQRDYYQTGDYLKIIVNASDNVAVKGYADLTEATGSGGLRDEGECELEDGYWICLWETGQVRDGYIKSADMKIIIEDLSGNTAEEDLEIEILESDIVNVLPDYWQLGEIEASPKSVDRQVTELVNQRVYFNVDLHGSYDLAGVELAGCTGDTEFLEDSYMHGDFVVLELKPFNSGQVKTLKYNCTLNLFTKKERTATYYPEVENVNLTIEFYNLGIGEFNTALAAKIKEAKKEANSGIYGTIGDLNRFMNYVRMICSFVSVAVTINKVINIFNNGLTGLRSTVFGKPYAVAGCAGAQFINMELNDIVDGIRIFCAVATCSPDSSLGWYADYQKSILKIYNGITIKNQLGLSSTTSLYDNLILSTFGFCIPGVIYNLDKYRQIKCRYVYCLENEVPAGTATIESCRELQDYQECKYIYGEVFQFIPFLSAADQMLQLFKSMLSDPIGIIRLAIVKVCIASCPESNFWVTVCDIGAWVVMTIDLANDITSSYTKAKTIKKDYCSEVL